MKICKLLFFHTVCLILVISNTSFKKYRQSVVGTWNKFHIAKRIIDKENTWIHQMIDVKRHFKNGTGYKKFYTKELFNQNNEFYYEGYIILVTFKYNTGKDNKGNYITYHYKTADTIKSFTNGKAISDRITNRVTEYMAGIVDKEETLYWKIIPDTSFYYIKSLQLTHDDGEIEVFHHQKKGYDKNL